MGRRTIGRNTTADSYWTAQATEPAPSSGLLALALMTVIALSVV